MSSVFIDLSRLLREVLSNSGWKRSSIEIGHNHPIFSPSILEHGDDAIIISSSFPINRISRGDKFPSVKDIQKQFDNYLEKLKDVLKRIVKGYHNITIVFQSGGDLEIPQWFLDFCKENGITIKILEKYSDLEAFNEKIYLPNEDERDDK